MGEAIYRGVEDPNDLTIEHDFDSADDARSFLETPRLAEIMSAAGVRGEPEIWITRSG